MARVWERHNHRNPCPVCGETKKGCRTNTKTNVTHCRGENPSPAYRFLKEDKHGFRMYKLESEISDFSEEKKQQWLEQKRREKERWLEQENQKIKSSLSNQERDRAIREILSQLPLTDEHREKLKARGLSDQQIQAGGYRSVSKWQKLETPVSPALAGVNRYGRGLNNPCDGIVVPIPNQNGEYVALRFHDPNAQETGNGKYTWLASNKQGCTQKDKETGEYPLAVYYPSEIQSPNRVGLCEGLEWKPKIAAERLGYPVIGFAGVSFFPQSPQLLNSALQELEATELIFIPDAGAVLNPRVIEPSIELFNLLEEWGYEEISIAWWNQIEKSNGDIDEISEETISDIALISPSDYLAKNPEQASYQRELESEAGGKEISQKEWETQKGQDFIELIKKHAGHQFNGFDEILNRQRFEREVNKVKKLIFGKDEIPKKNPSNGILHEIKFKKGKRSSCVQELIKKGYHYILDTSATGTGKTHELNQLESSEGKTWYIHADHRNPTTETAAQKADLPSRHNGLVQDTTRETATGDPYVRRWKWSKEQPEPDIEGNCFQADRFNKLAAKGYDVNSRNTATNDGKDNFICATCPQRGSCTQFGYKGERRDALANPAIRAHIDSMPNPDCPEDGLSYENDIAIFEEASTLFQATKERILSQTDLDQQWNWIEEEAPKVYQRLLPYKQNINAMLAGKIKVPHYGATSLPEATEEESLQYLLGIIPYDGFKEDLLIVWQIIEKHRAVADQGLADYKTNKVDRYNGLTPAERKKWKSAIALADSYLHGETSQHNDQVIANIPTLGLYEILAILFGKEDGVVRIGHGKVKLTLAYERHRAIAHDMKANIFADATMSPEELAAKLGVPREEIAVISQEQPDLSNLTVKAIYMEGMRSRQYSPDCQRRQLALVDHLKSEYIDTESALIAWKDTNYLDIDGYWFHDSRSTNTLKGVPNLIAVGTPYQNYGMVKDEYYTIHGTLKGFDDYYDSLRQAEIIQLLGRQRCHLYPDQNFTIYLIATNIDFTFLEAMGVTVHYSHALEWTEKAGSTSQQNKLRLIQIGLELGEDFRKLSQTEIGQKLGVKQSCVSKLINQAGGKDRLLRLFQFLYKRFIGVGITSSGLLSLKILREYLKIDDEDCQKIFADTVISMIQSLRDFLANGGKDIAALEEKTELPACLIVAIALGASPPT
ncbi:hypothetical protein FRE64_16515 (plasmid) [Euhalothece natronophila Z-M001]|uniref:DUF3854 domain-containing protein n=1 Tax=Euhalothece natronophila Z-M001 TaxID=522448 RepID=A0A5B8NRF7_9CHRO|nr:hypothetical protein [Euhalothece natronophila]QDZ41577.1 hypothetical protein FRE64_16515 [Euhalothece natronophila Z-M001]